MPQDGEINSRFGVYVSLCCGGEIIIRQGATFPGCPNHSHITTTWKQVETETIDPKAHEKDTKSDPAA